MLLLLASVALIGIAVLMMTIKLIFQKGSRFPSGHVGDVPALRRKGIDCHAAQFYDEEHRQTLADRISSNA